MTQQSDFYYARPTANESDDDLHSPAFDSQSCEDGSIFNTQAYHRGYNTRSNFTATRVFLVTTPIHK